MQDGAPMIAQAIMTSLTTGTFLYIAMTEIMPHEFANPQFKNMKILGFLVGFMCFNVFMYLESNGGHGHSHGGEHGGDGHGGHEGHGHNDGVCDADHGNLASKSLH